MIVCITSAGRDLESAVHPSFGRTPYFLFVDTETSTVDAVENVPGAHGAGVQAAQTVAEHGAKAVITGSVGPNAFSGLNAAGIEIFVGAAGTGNDALAAYRSGTLESPHGPTGRAHQGGPR